MQEWTTNVGDAIPYVDEHNVSRPLTGFGAGDGLLVVPTNSKLVAYGYNNTSLLSSLVSPPGSGSIIADPASPDGYYLNGTPVGLTAAPASGYAFTGWSGDTSGTPNPVNIVMDTDKTVTANFKAKRYLTLSSSTGGTCTASPDHTGSGDYYLDGDPVSITATPSSSSYMFTGWGGDASGGATLLNITMSANKTISASFALKNRIDLSVSQNGTAVTIMATMYYNGSPSSGKTLTFYNQKGNTGGFVSIGTAVTNASGVATRTYTAAPGSNTVYASFAPSGGISPMISSSVPYTISKVTLVDPVNGAYITDTNIPTLLWSELSGGTGTYHIQVATAPTFGTAVIYEADVSNLVCIMPSPLAIGKKYYWHVYSYLPNGRSSYSDTWSFTCKYSSELSFVYLREDGYNVTFELVLTGGSMPLPGRVLNIYDGATLKASGTTLANGTMTKTITSTLGDHNFSARFSGDANDVPAATDSYPLNINKIWATSPKNGAVGEINGFGWVSCSCYTSYFVEIATASTFGSAIIYEMNVTGGGCTLPSGLLTVGRTYYWRVQGLSPIGASVWSDTSSFVYKKGATLSVVLTSQNGSTVKLKTTLTRTDDGVPLPSRMVKIYDGTTLPANGTTLADGTVSSTFTSPEGECCYTVKFAGDATYAPASSGVWALIGKVALTSPANASLVTDELPWLNWSAYTDFYGTGSETKYHIQVATAPTFGTTIIYDTDVDGYLTFPIPSPLIMGKTYYWHVLSYVLYGRSKYSNTWSFTYKGGTSISPQLLSQDGQKATLIAKLTDGSGGPLSGKTVFFYEGATLKAYGTTGADGSYRATITSPVGSHTYTAKFNGDAYYAPAAPADVPVVIGKVVLSSPAMGAVVTTATPTLSWVAYSGDTTKYHVQVSSSSTFAAGTFKLDSDTVGAETSITPSALTRGVTYYWRVTAILPTGSSVWSDYRTIVYKAGTIISISAPVSVVGSKVTVTVTLTDASSNKLYGKTLTFYDEAIGASAYTIRGTAVTAGAASTNPPPGEAVKSWTLLAAPEPGTRQVKVAFAGDSNYLPATVTMGYPRPNGGNIMAIGVSPGYSTDSTLFAGTATGNIIKSTNSGASWSVVNSSGQAIRTIALSPNYTTDQTLLVGTDGGVLKSSNGGSSWNAANAGISNLYIQALAVSPDYSVDHTIFAGTNSGGAYKSVNGGSSWTAIGTMSYISALAISPDFANDQILYAAGTLGVYKSMDGGSSWTTLSTPSSAYMALALSPNYAANLTIYAGAYDGAGIIKSTDGGVSWSTVKSTLYVESLAISPNYVNDMSIYAGCQNGVGVLKSTDGGANWSASNTGLFSSDVTSLAISPAYASDDTLFAGTSSGGLYNGVYKSTNGAASWGAVY